MGSLRVSSKSEIRLRLGGLNNVRQPHGHRYIHHTHLGLQLNAWDVMGTTKRSPENEPNPKTMAGLTLLRLRSVNGIGSMMISFLEQHIEDIKPCRRIQSVGLLLTNPQISSTSTFWQFRSRILASMILVHPSPTRTPSRMIVSR